jgi:hypothetical protein
MHSRLLHLSGDSRARKFFVGEQTNLQVARARIVQEKFESDDPFAFCPIRINIF